MKRDLDASTWAAVVATLMVLAGLRDNPYSYYQLLRLVLCFVSLYLAFGTTRHLLDWQRWALGASAVVYNPIIPIRLGSKSVWTLLNLLTVVLFWWVEAQRESRR